MVLEKSDLTKVIKGSFNNHVDMILTIFYPLPPLGGQIWTFLTPFSYVQMDLVDIYQPPSPPIHVHMVIERSLSEGPI